MKILIILLIVFLGTIGEAQAPVMLQLTLAWDANPEQDLAGYKLYISDFSGEHVLGNFVETIPAGEEIVTVLVPVRKTYFTLTAFNDADLESDFSNEISNTLDQQSFTFIVTPDLSDLSGCFIQTTI